MELLQVQENVGWTATSVLHRLPPQVPMRLLMETFTNGDVQQMGTRAELPAQLQLWQQATHPGMMILLLTAVALTIGVTRKTLIYGRA
jgi:hypothetical protein